MKSFQYFLFRLVELYRRVKKPNKSSVRKTSISFALFNQHYTPVDHTVYVIFFISGTFVSDKTFLRIHRRNTNCVRRTETRTYGALLTYIKTRRRYKNRPHNNPIIKLTTVYSDGKQLLVNTVKLRQCLACAIIMRFSGYEMCLLYYANA